MSGCSLLPDGRMVFSCYRKDIVTFLNEEGVKLFQIGKDETRACLNFFLTKVNSKGFDSTTTSPKL
jgi:hypothetical protein